VGTTKSTCTLSKKIIKYNQAKLSSKLKLDFFLTPYIFPTQCMCKQNREVQLKLLGQVILKKSSELATELLRAARLY
jgi:hypothetical protein